MTTEEIREKMMLYLNDELKSVYRFVNVNPDFDVHFVKKCAKDRGMGVVMFVQSLGLEYEDIKNEYEKFKEYIDNI